MLLDLGIPIQRIERWVCDHDAEDRATLERHLGITTTAAFKDVSSGIQAVQTRLTKRTLFLNLNAVDTPDPELEKRYLPTSTAGEITGYSWSDKKAETPVKEFDHGMDEMRYVVAYVDKLNKKPIQVSSTKASVQNYISSPTKTGV
jgi:phage terminase large subunit